MKLLIVLIFAGWLALFVGFGWMIGLGAIAHIFNEPKLAISYWNSVLVVFVVNFLLGLGLSGENE